MPGSPQSWATQQLAEFLAGISACADEPSAVRSGVQRAAEALEADAGAFVSGGDVVESLGFAAGRAPVAELMKIAAAGRGVISLPGAGECHAESAPLEASAGHLVLARSEHDPFTAAELTFLHSMARVLGMTLRQLRGLSAERALRERSEVQAAENAMLLEALRHRQLVLERLSRIQSSILRRVAREDVLEAIVGGAYDLIGDEMVTLRLRDPDDPGSLLIVASRGLDDRTLSGARRAGVDEGASGLAATQGSLVVMEDYPRSADANPARVSETGVEAAMAAPVREGDRVVGTLLVATSVAGRRYSEAEREALVSLAEHASLALTDAQRVEAAIHQALHDPLTGLPNRTLFFDRLEHALAGRAREPPAVLFIDLDSFKQVNDTLGHAAGDRLLMAVAERLAACARREDTFARLGGDEFAMLIEEADDAAAAIVAQRLLEALIEPFTLEGAELYMQASIGIACGHETPGTLLRNADLAMYEAKAIGRGHYELYDPRLHAAVVERVEIEKDLRQAISARELSLQYQPIVELDGERVVGVEALVRWRHPRRGMLSPAVFLPVAEDTGLMNPIGRWVIEEACRQGARWHATAGTSIAVNLSASQLHDPQIVEVIEDALRSTGLDPSALLLEITETNLMEDIDAISHRLAHLKALGVGIAVDDFGTGYSSLHYLDRLPIDVLKIDKLFIDGLGAGGPETTLARAIINLGRSLRLRVVAEGIERPEQVTRLRELGCLLGQGFLLHRPMDGAAIDALLGARQVVREPEPRPR